MCETEYFTPEQCLELRCQGWQQGISAFVWHCDKHNRDKWELYKRNNFDISSFGDRYGYNRWVSAVPIDNLLAEELLNKKDGNELEYDNDELE